MKALEGAERLVFDHTWDQMIDEALEVYESKNKKSVAQKKKGGTDGKKSAEEKKTQNSPSKVKVAQNSN